MISLLTKLPFISSLLGFFTSKKRLFCEYGLIAIVVIIGGFTVGQWYSKTQLEKRLASAEATVDKVSSRLVLVEAVNNAHEQTLNNLRELRERDVVALEGLLNDYRALSLRDQQVRSQLNELRKSNQNVEIYLSQPVPDELARMLNATAPNRTGNQDSN